MDYWKNEVLYQLETMDNPPDKKDWDVIAETIADEIIYDDYLWEVINNRIQNELRRFTK